MKETKVGCMFTCHGPNDDNLVFEDKQQLVPAKEKNLSFWYGILGTCKYIWWTVLCEISIIFLFLRANKKRFPKRNINTWKSFNDWWNEGGIARYRFWHNRINGGK